MEVRLQLLVEPLCLAVGLRMVSRTETVLGSQSSAEGLPDMGGELWSPFRNNLQRDAMKPEDMVNQELSSLKG